MSLEQEAKTALSTLRFPHQDSSDQVEKNGDGFSRGFRVHEFFTSKPSEEDDDWPQFTGRAKVKQIIDNHFAHLIKQGVKVDFNEDEKSWFSVYVMLPKTAAIASELVKIAKELLEA